MKIVKRKIIPDCQVCGQQLDYVNDVPLEFGYWGYLCDRCLSGVAVQGHHLVGVRMEKSDIDEELPYGPVRRAKPRPYVPPKPQPPKPVTVVSSCGTFRIVSVRAVRGFPVKKPNGEQVFVRLKCFKFILEHSLTHGQTVVIHNISKEKKVKKGNTPREEARITVKTPSGVKNSFSVMEFKNRYSEKFGPRIVKTILDIFKGRI